MKTTGCFPVSFAFSTCSASCSVIVFAAIRFLFSFGSPVVVDAAIYPHRPPRM